MIEGFVKDGQRYNVTIFTAHANAWSMRAGNFRQTAKLLTPKKAAPDHQYPLSPIGLNLDTSGYGFGSPSDYIAVLDTILHIENHESIWRTLCTNSIFDIWDWLAPFNSLNGKADPMILVLRIFQVDHCFTGELREAGNRRYGVVPEQPVGIIREVVPNDRFEEIKNTLRNVLGRRLRKEEECTNTNGLVPPE